MRFAERQPDYEEYEALRSVVGWQSTEEPSTQKALAHGLYSVVAINNDKVVGMGRIVGDGGLYFYIQDLIVHPNYQGEGLGRQIMTMLMAFLIKHTQPGSFIGLMATPGLEHYYEEFGFNSGPEGGVGMYQFVK